MQQEVQETGYPILPEHKKAFKGWNGDVKKSDKDMDMSQVSLKGSHWDSMNIKIIITKVYNLLNKIRISKFTLINKEEGQATPYVRKPTKKCR